MTASPAPAPDGAYLTATAARRFAAARHIDGLAGVDDAALQPVLLRASEWLDRAFDFIGQPASPAQLRAFPRIHLHAPDDEDAPPILPPPILPPPILPPVIHQAVVELAIALLSSEGEAEQLLGLRGAVAREQVGAITVSWRARRGAQGRLAHLLRPYLKGGQSGQTGTIRLHRS